MSTTKFETLSVATYTDAPTEIWEFEDCGPVNPYHSIAGPLATMRDDDDDLDYAYLFAAAPELLNALIDVMGWFDSAAIRNLMAKQGWQSECSRIINDARAAIAKATTRP